MKRLVSMFACAALIAHLPLSAQEAKPAPAPGEIVAAAKADEWVGIAPSDLIVMDLAADSKGKPRRVVVQLIPAPFSQGWVSNIRKLAAAKYWDGTSVNRVQDNYVVQWGDATEKRALPQGLQKIDEKEYATAFKPGMFTRRYTSWGTRTALVPTAPVTVSTDFGPDNSFADAYITNVGFASGFPVGMSYRSNRGSTDPQPESGFDKPDAVWPIHCYGMVGVGRNLSPDTGTGAELYTVIGHAPRHLDRNIALVGRVIEGIEHLSSLPRGTGALGFYEKEEERVPILAIRLGNDAGEVPTYEYLSTESASFAAYADARANRRDPFFNVPAGGADICNIPVPVRRKAK